MTLEKTCPIDTFIQHFSRIWTKEWEEKYDDDNPETWLETPMTISFYNIDYILRHCWVRKPGNHDRKNQPTVRQPAADAENPFHPDRQPQFLWRVSRSSLDVLSWGTVNWFNIKNGTIEEVLVLIQWLGSTFSEALEGGKNKEIPSQWRNWTTPPPPRKYHLSVGETLGAVPVQGRKYAADRNLHRPKASTAMSQGNRITMFRCDLGTIVFLTFLLCKNVL